jgi:hypothetical protein
LEPWPSVPIPPATIPEARALATPVLESPHTRPRSHGFCAQPLNLDGIPGRDHALPEIGIGERHAANRDQLLDGERHAVQRPELLACHDCFLCSLRGLAGTLDVEHSERVQIGIERFAARQEVLGNFDRRHVARRQQFPEPPRRKPA